MGRRTETAHARICGCEHALYGDLRFFDTVVWDQDDRDLPLTAPSRYEDEAFERLPEAWGGVQHADVLIVGKATRPSIGFGMRLPDGRSDAALTRS